MSEFFGYLSAIVIGFTLGLIGGGGSILTVPALVYIIGVSPVLSTSYSLFVVGVSALVGSLNYMRKGLVSYQTAVVFAIPSFLAVYTTRKFVVPAVPDVIFSSERIIVSKDLAIMVLFALIMLMASISMIMSGRKELPKEMAGQEPVFNYPLILLEGALVGALTGLVGAGGGFLIIPALVLMAKLPMKLAVGTSLLIIAAKSLIGFVGDIEEQPIEWSFIIPFTAIAVAGIFIGSYVSRYVANERLKSWFGWFVLFMSFYILFKEVF
ncbi:sulfite exporter TauE/SafE family protein [Fulvivirga ulvae]|uniref:sulfite exporter TauE/SafE family protein n=1 Tax=Fulvivirga ulvae TaxID=2904245 RepID=UPI001F471C2F|nr:sulfite exporter TauE/SafE family protein [Fulvivirga ulvae]UII30034.1 sulfite exporter TauE/SafE family protein [Fulvivirga ulvae]